VIDRTPPPEIVKRRWYALGQRHRRMAELLRRWRFFDGVVFHAYHGYECAISAYLAAAGIDVPPSHNTRLNMFEAVLDRSGPTAEAYQQLDFFLVPVRNQALYYQANRDLLPADRFDAVYVDLVMPLVHAFARSVWREIR